ncbi:TIGR03086 family metal-binding protein [Nocardioides houyundeii]|uniref:TIGR03086 family metal-binding protein n=1 Tax=Nocardioides houyundeii TaxID=2045452 RepID=UPI000DF22E8D|nr:TIGR03086 family metal-binding protein [Nocardioides houyundeii]
MTLPAQPAARHRAVAATFTHLVRGVDDWDAPSPVPGWAARDVVDHLVTWFPAFLASGSGHRWPPGPPVSEDPLAAWTAQVRGVQSLLDDPEAAASTFSHPQVGEQELASAVSSFYTADVFMHSWDLARASGQPVTLDADACQQLVSSMRAMETAIRQSGQFGTAQPVAADASAQDRLVAFIGRDPGWAP